MVNENELFQIGLTISRIAAGRVTVRDEDRNLAAVRYECMKVFVFHDGDTQTLRRVKINATNSENDAIAFARTNGGVVVDTYSGKVWSKPLGGWVDFVESLDGWA